VNKKHNHIDQLTEEVLAAYRSGQLTPDQQHAVEKLMLDDPFYLEAEEGKESITPMDFATDMSELENRLNAKLNEDSKVLFWTSTRRLAAAIILILASSMIFLWLQNNNKQPSELSAEKEVEVIENKTDSIPLLNLDALEQPNLAASKLSGKPKIFDPMPPTIQPNELDIAFIPEELGEIVFETEAEPTPIPPLALRSEEATELKLADLDKMKAQRSIIADKNDAEKARFATLQNSLQGKVAGVQVEQPKVTITVIDADDLLPLPQVQVFIKNTINGYTSNTLGRAEIPVDSSAIYVVRYLGYVTQEFNLAVLSKTKNTIRLEADVTSLGEVVVTGFGATDESADQSKSAAPVDGVRNFNQYINRSFIYPEIARETKVRGRVTVEFVVNMDGTLSDFEIIKGLGAGCDEEAIRLIKEGPKWNAALESDGNSIATKVRIKIRFKP
jgi:TonB family protein